MNTLHHQKQLQKQELSLQQNSKDPYVPKHSDKKNTKKNLASSHPNSQQLHQQQHHQKLQRARQYPQQGQPQYNEVKHQDNYLPGQRLDNPAHQKSADVLIYPNSNIKQQQVKSQLRKSFM